MDFYNIDFSWTDNGYLLFNKIFQIKKIASQKTFINF